MSKTQAIPKTELVKTNLLKSNPNNPRVIRDDKFYKLVKSIKEFPEMLQLRPIVVDADMVVLGGNMRLKACTEAGMKDVPVLKAEHLTKEQQARFIIADNVSFGEWNYEALANEWDADELDTWGLDIPVYDSDVDYSENNKEAESDGMETLMTISLKYESDEYWKVKEQLSHIAETPEKALWKLLGNV